ncbi:MAG: aminoglycoside 3-N-acetyltransferase [Anaerolineae bacterium]|nr:aminoglycoside 3-N-acetyltransferase [Anaerolineae bacterium]
MSDSIPYTQTQLVEGFKALGVSPGQVVMLHASVKSVGHIMGGPNVILQALLEALTPTGTVMMYAGWQDIPDFVGELSLEARQVYYEQHPAFDPAIARSVRENSVLVEFLRTWPGTQRSANPEASMVALGSHAALLTQNHPLNYGYGTGSPLEKLVQLNGRVLMLGAPLYTITLLHYAEYCAKLRHKKIIHYQCPVLQNGQKLWLDIEDYATGEVHDEYSFEQIAMAYLAEEGKGRRGQVGQADSYLLDAADLSAFAIHWLERHFGG